MNDPNDLERRLRARQPTAALDRDQVLYEAGRRVGRREGRSVLWPLATLVSTALAIVFALQLALREAPLEPEAPKTVPPLVAPSTLPPLMAPAIRHWEQRVLDEGLEGLGPITPLAPANTTFSAGEFK
jgi:hypothetical protein